MGFSCIKNFESIFEQLFASFQVLSRTIRIVSLALMAREIFTKNYSGVHYFLPDLSQRESQLVNTSFETHQTEV